MKLLEFLKENGISKEVALLELNYHFADKLATGTMDASITVAEFIRAVDSEDKLPEVEGGNIDLEFWEDSDDTYRGGELVSSERYVIIDNFDDIEVKVKNEVHPIFKNILDNFISK